ncbi:MAG: M20/M25/M40 family metallo-hydrolase [Coriobacteriia bacterium]|nr:M20/M25/M40 family metallo-hydrolase [Coriobacteriia bacterium]MBN2839987.1 M20/M25/M40 family metallo-hydrolase [Coriobacteriia bacterium]
MMERVLDTFLDLVRISSPTGQESRVAAYVAEALREAGCEVRFDDTRALTGADTGNLIAVLSGSLEGGVLAFSAHMDCVQPCEGVEPVVTGGLVRSAGDTILGGDDKVGLAAIIEAVRRLTENGEAHRPLKLLLTVSEEEGLLGAKALAPEDAASSLCLVLDADGPVGGIVVGAPSHYTFEATFGGRAAHAGVEPEKGISAIAMAADAIGRMKLGRLDDHTTANIGSIAGGSATNVVAPSCRVTGECRSLDPLRAEAVRDSLDTAMRDAAAAAGGTVMTEWDHAYNGFTVPVDSSEVRSVMRACEAIGVAAHTYTTGGGSDANVFATHGIPTLVLGTGMTSVHSTDETLEVVELERLADLLVALATAPGL